MSSIIGKAPAYLLFCLFALSQSTESIFTTGLPQISEEFAINEGLAQFSSSIYFYGFAFGILILGRISDKIGRKPVLIFGLSLFLISCLISFYVTQIYFLIIIRFIQAFGASVGSVIAQAMARDSYRGPELSKLFASLSAGLAIMPALSALIGGNIVEQWGWRYNFIYLFSVVFIVYTACIFKLPETNNFVANKESKSFIYILKIMLLDKKVLCYGAMIGFYNGIMYSFFTEAPFIFIKTLKIDPSKYGFLILMLSLAGFFGSIISRTLQGKGVKGKIIIKKGLILSLISCFCFALLALSWYYNILHNENAKRLIIIPMLTQSISFTMVMPLILRYSLEDYIKVNGTAGSVLGTYYYLIIATINFITTRLHSENIVRIAFFFLFLSIMSSFLYFVSKDFEKFISPFKE